MKIEIGTEELSGDSQVVTDWGGNGTRITCLRIFLDGELVVAQMDANQDRPSLVLRLNSDHSDSAQKLIDTLLAAAHAVQQILPY